MLCLGGCSLSGLHCWDDIHTTVGCQHDNYYCVRASVSMINSYYFADKQKHLSQDRISYYIRSSQGVELDLGHGDGFYPYEITDALNWSLSGTPSDFYEFKPTYQQVKQWIDAGRPILRANQNHVTVIDGYDDADQSVLVIDPMSGTESPVRYSSLPISLGVWVAPAPGSISPRSDESTLSQDSDGDGIVDFDEINRFHTDPNAVDSDGDGVGDKEEVRCYTFLADDSFDITDQRKPDSDNDGLRAELDGDSDNGGRLDGMEDLNGNGKVDYGEMDPLVESDDEAVDLAVVSVQPSNATPVFQVYQGGMWYMGNRAVMVYNVTVSRVDSHAWIPLVMSNVTLKRTDVADPGETQNIATSLTGLYPAQTR